MTILQVSQCCSQLTGALCCTQAHMNEQYKAEVSHTFVVLNVDWLNMAKQLIILNDLKLHEVHAPVLLQMRHCND